MGARDMGLVDQRPVFIAGSPRSGTTMIAGLLVLHGFWVGESRVTKEPSSNSLIATENIPLKKAMNEELKRMKYKNRGVPLPTVEAVRHLNWIHICNVAEDVLPSKGRWLLKTAGLLLFYEFWNEKFPDALWVFPRRNPEDIVASIRRHPKMRFSDNSRVGEFVEQILERQEVVEKQVKNSMYVPAKAVANLDMDLITEYFRFCDVEMDEKIVRDFIKPKMMH